jgi:hypothetical protein
MVMDKNQYKRGENGGTPVRELKWMAEFLASHGHQKKALEIYRALVETITDKKSNEDKRLSPDDERDQAA